MINSNSNDVVDTKEIPQVRCDSFDLKTTRERELMRRMRAGETDLFYELIRPYERGVFFAAASILGNDADAEEVVQEAMLKAFKNLASFRQESKFSTWLIQIAINEAKMKLRKDRRHLYDSIDNGRTTDEGDYIPTDFADWREIPSDALEQSELREALDEGAEVAAGEVSHGPDSSRCAADEHCGNGPDTGAF